MGQDSQIFEESLEFLYKTKDDWLKKFSGNDTINIPRGKKRIIVVDGPGILQYRNWFAPTEKYKSEHIYAQSVEDLCEVVTKRMEYLMGMENVTGLLLLMDKNPPATKLAKSDRRNNNTPITPLQLVKGENRTRLELGTRAWQAWFEANPFIAEDTTKNDANGNPYYNWKLPDSRPNKEQIKNGYNGQGPFYEDYLRNKDFKRLLYSLICRGVHRRISTDPARKQFVVVQCTDYIKVKKSDGTSALVSEELNLDYGEVDTSIGYWIEHFNSRGFDVICESDDGDVPLCALLASDQRIVGPRDNILSVAFTGSAYVVQCRWRKSVTRVFDINAYWRSIHLTFGALAQYHNVHIANCIGTYTLLSMLGGTDYVRSFPGARVKTVLTAFFQFFPDILANGPLVGNHWQDPQGFEIYYDTYERLVMAIYTKVRGNSVKFDFDDPETSLNKLVDSRTDLDIERIRTTYANALYCIRYFVQSAYRMPMLDGFLEIDGQSVYGFVMTNPELDNQGQPSVHFAKDARRGESCF